MTEKNFSAFDLRTNIKIVTLTDAIIKIVHAVSAIIDTLPTSDAKSRAFAELREASNSVDEVIASYKTEFAEYLKPGDKNER